jgi:DNA-binding beta-propeller fold protein YncE
VIPFSLDSQLHAELNTVYTSIEITVDGVDGSAIATVDAGEILRNGTPSGLSASVVNGDVLSVTLTSSSLNNTSVYANLDIDGVHASFRVTTNYDEPYPVYDSEREADHPLHAPFQDNGLPYYPAQPEAIYKLDGFNSLTRIQYGTPTRADFEAGNSYIFVANFFEDSVHKIDSGTNETVNVYSVGRKPYMVIQQIDGEDQYLWVTLYGDSKVVKYDVDFSVVEEYEVPNPIGIDMQGSDVFVASYSSNRLYKISGGVSSYIDVGEKPFNVRVNSSDGNVWVTNSGSDTVSYVSGVSFDAATEVVVGVGPWGLGIDGSSTWVTTSKGGELVKISGGTVTDSYKVGVVPLAVVARGGELYVSEHEQPLVYRVSAGGTVLQTLNLVGGGRAVDMDLDEDGNIWLTDYYPDLPSRYVDSDDDPKPFSVADNFSESLDTLVESAPVLVEGINIATNASLDHSFMEAVLVVNGVEQGQSTSVSLGDEIQIKMRSSDAPDVVRRAWLTIGNREEEWVLKTLNLEEVVDPFQFITKKDATPGVTYTSNTVTIAGLPDGVSVQGTFSGDGVVYHNGTEVAYWPIDVFNDDTFYITQVAPAVASRAAIGTLSCGVTQGAYIVRTDCIDVQFTMGFYEDYDPYEASFTQDSSTNAVHVINPGAANYVIPIADNTGGTVPTGNVVLSGAYFDNKIHLIDQSTKVIFETFTSVTKPFALSAVKTEDDVHYAAVSSHDTGIVRIFTNLDETDYQDISVGTKPTGICSNGTDMFACASFTNGEVKILRASESGFILERTVEVGGGPLLMAAQPDSDFVWVTNSLDDTVTKIDTTDGSTQTFSVGRTPWGIDVTDTSVYVSNSSENTIHKLDLDGNLIDGTVTEEIPFHIGYNSTTSSLWVSHLLSHSVYEYDDNLDPVGQVSLPNYSYGLDVDGDGNVWVASYWPNTFDRVQPGDQDVDTLTLGDRYVENVELGAEASYLYDFENEIDHPTMLHIGGEYGSYIVVNGHNWGTSALVDKDDVIQVFATVTSAAYYDHFVQVFTCEQQQNIVYRTTPDTTPSYFQFEPLFDQYIGIPVSSNTVTVDGMTPGAFALMEVDKGTIILNGSDTGSNAVDIQLGDEVSLRVELGGPYGSTTTVNVVVGFMGSTWNVTTMVLGDAFESWTSNSRRSVVGLKWLPNLGLNRFQFDNLYAGAQSNKSLFSVGGRTATARLHNDTTFEISGRTPELSDVMFAAEIARASPIYMFRRLEPIPSTYSASYNRKTLHGSQSYGWYDSKSTLKPAQALDFAASAPISYGSWLPVGAALNTTVGFSESVQLGFTDSRLDSHFSTQWGFTSWWSHENFATQWLWSDWRENDHERTQWEFVDWSILSHERTQWTWEDWRYGSVERNQLYWDDWRYQHIQRNQWPWEYAHNTIYFNDQHFDHRSYLSFEQVSAPEFDDMRGALFDIEGPDFVSMKLFSLDEFEGYGVEKTLQPAHINETQGFVRNHATIMSVDKSNSWVVDALVINGYDGTNSCRYYPYSTESEAHAACLAAGYEESECGTMIDPNGCWAWYHIVEPLTECDALERPVSAAWYIQGG